MKVRVLLVAGLLGSALLAPPAQAADVLPSFAQVRTAHHSSDAVLLDRQGVPLADLRLDPRVHRLDWVPLEKLPLAMRQALLVAEDKRFFEHDGVDWKAFIGAAWQNLWYHVQRGASTLTMQLAGMLDPALALPGQGRERRSLTQKWDQGVAALELERRWSKAQILEAYLNLAPFRGDLQGIGAASEELFGIPASSLTRREAVILAVLLRGPNAHPSLVARRACVLATKLGSPRLCPDITRLALSRLDAPRNHPRYTLAPQLARRLLTQPGQQVATTLDARLQRRSLDSLRDAHVPDASAVLLDNASGAVLAWVGAADADAADGVTARRSLGGWWWPQAAALALEHGSASAASLLADTTQLSVQASQPSQPQYLSLRTALAMHQTGALHQLLSLTGLPALTERLQALGLELPANPDQPDARGDASLLQLAAAWRPLVAGGRFVPARVLANDNGERAVLTPGAAFITADMLASTGHEGWQTQWLLRQADGGAVLVGASDRFTLAVAARGNGHAAADNAARLWDTLLAAAQQTPSQAPPAPDGVESSVVAFEPPVETARREWFLRGDKMIGAGYRRY